MRPLTLTIAGTLAACVFPSDTPPKVIYQSAETIGLEYADEGMMHVSNRQAVIEMIERHCGVGWSGILGGELTLSAFDKGKSSVCLRQADCVTGQWLR